MWEWKRPVKRGKMKIQYSGRGLAFRLRREVSSFTAGKKGDGYSDGDM